MSLIIKLAVKATAAAVIPTWEGVDAFSGDVVREFRNDAG
jgi:hypothetical protein